MVIWAMFVTMGIGYWNINWLGGGRDFVIYIFQKKWNRSEFETAVSVFRNMHIWTKSEMGIKFEQLFKYGMRYCGRSYRNVILLYTFESVYKSKFEIVYKLQIGYKSKFVIVYKSKSESHPYTQRSADF